VLGENRRDLHKVRGFARRFLPADDRAADHASGHTVEDLPALALGAVRRPGLLARQVVGDGGGFDDGHRGHVGGAVGLRRSDGAISTVSTGLGAAAG
jgi:hypothetical protein